MISLSPILTHHAVLQRDRENRIWGEIISSCYKTIGVDCFLARDESVLCEARITLSPTETPNHYSFVGYLPPQQAGGPYTIHVLCFAAENRDVIEETQITDIYFGDVYLMAGQSNMEFRLSSDDEYKNHAISDFDYPLIRSFRVPRVDYPGAVPEKNPDNCTWLLLSEATAGRFSAVSYYFARNLFLSSDEKIPIGLIDSNRGGTSASTWVDETCLQKDPELETYLDEYQELLASLDVEQNRRDNEVYYATLEVYNKEAEQLGVQKVPWPEIEERLGLYPWPPPPGPFAYRSPCVLYHTMIEPFTQFEIRAVLYYQGEEDVGKSALYKKLLRSLILFWREAFGQPTLPFVLVQIAPYDYLGELGDMAGNVRLAQSDLSQELQHVSLVATTDCGVKDNIHPPSKRIIGERLSLSVQKNVLGIDIQAEGPIYQSVRAVNGGLAVKCKTNSAGLMFGRDGHEIPCGFSVTPDGQNWFPADARIEGEEIYLTTLETDNPIAARYAFGGYVPANLYNSHSLPGVPFVAVLSDEKT